MCSYLALPRVLTAWILLLSQSLELRNYFRLRIQACPVFMFSLVKQINLYYSNWTNTEKGNFPNSVIFLYITCTELFLAEKYSCPGHSMIV